MDDKWNEEIKWVKGIIRMYEEDLFEGEVVNWHDCFQVFCQKIEGKGLHILESIGQRMYDKKVVGLKRKAFFDLVAEYWNEGSCEDGILDYFLKQKYIVKKEILQLTLKEKWFKMIFEGKKKEEYRELKNYWAVRLCHKGEVVWDFRLFDEVWFRNGYGLGRRS